MNGLREAVGEKASYRSAVSVAQQNILGLGAVRLLGLLKNMRRLREEKLIGDTVSSEKVISNGSLSSLRWLILRVCLE